MREGAGKMNSETLKPRQISSHSSSTTTSSSQGAQRLALRSRHCAIVHRAAHRLHGLADGADVLAQLEHDVGELLGVGELQLARARQLDLALDHDAARAAAHHVDGVGEEDRLAQVVRDEDDVELLRRPAGRAGCTTALRA